MRNKRVIQKPNITKCAQLNNVVVDGYMSSEMLYNEMTKGGRVAIEYIEKLKAQYNQEAQNKIENDIEFEAQLSKAYRNEREKIDAHYEQTQALKKVNEAQIKYNNEYEKLKKAQEEYERAKSLYFKSSQANANSKEEA